MWKGFLDIGGVQPSIKVPHLLDMTIPIVSYEEQKAIASVLSSLDDKIDLLHRQNKTLEAMAETLFRQWFVEESEEDWTEGKIGDLFVLQRGFDLPTQNRIKGIYPIYAASGYSGGHIEFKVKAPGVTTGRSGLLGKVFFVMDDFWPLNTSLYIKEFRIGTPLFSYFFLKGLDLESLNAGSAVPTLNRNHVHEESTVIPPQELIRDFEKMALPFYLKIRKNKMQLKILETLRDTLLPKLMSGEVRVEV
ncbi:restriction endonuclease subunit S [Nitrosomonas sp. Is79A3]|uniref:restriction endonuclease subunit S n=1 Tax=Nitrosomonas sp. (strain Is79A3) TaxID=261292 RepID=UPI0018DEC9FA